MKTTQPLRGIQLIELLIMTSFLLMSELNSQRDAVFSFLPSQQKRKSHIFSAASASRAKRAVSN
jgi:hypothetical protein